MRYGPGERLPDPSWKSGPPDPPEWTLHEHEFEEPYMVEFVGNYVHAYWDCIYDERCEATKTADYVLYGIAEAGIKEWPVLKIDELKPYWRERIEEALDQEINHENKYKPPRYEWGIADEVAVRVKVSGVTFEAFFEMEDEVVHEY